MVVSFISAIRATPARNTSPTPRIPLVITGLHSGEQQADGVGIDAHEGGAHVGL